MSGKETLESLVAKLQVACEQRDWEALAELDTKLRKMIERFVGMARTDSQKAQLSAWLRRIQTVYDLMRQDAEKHRDEVGRELRKLSRDTKAVNSYLDSAGY